MRAITGRLLQLPKELDVFPYTKAYLNSQRIVSRVNEEEKSALPIKYKKPTYSSATVDIAWLNHRGKIYPTLTQGDKIRKPLARLANRHEDRATSTQITALRWLCGSAFVRNKPFLECR